jgi:hypothetical protein
LATALMARVWVEKDDGMIIHPLLTSTERQLLGLLILSKDHAITFQEFDAFLKCSLQDERDNSNGREVSLQNLRRKTRQFILGGCHLQINIKEDREVINLSYT